MPFSHRDDGGGRQLTPAEILQLLGRTEGFAGTGQPQQESVWMPTQHQEGFAGLGQPSVNIAGQATPLQDVINPAYYQNPGSAPNTIPQPPQDMGSSDFLDNIMGMFGGRNSVANQISPMLGLNRRTPQPGGGGDPLLRRLIKSLTNVPQIDYGQLISGNQEAIRAAYAPQIQGLRQQNRATNREFGQNRELISGLANQAYNQITRQGDRAVARGEQNVADIQQQVSQEAAGINRGETQQARQMAGLLRGMGQEQAAPGITEQIIKEGGKEAKAVRSEGAVERRIAKKSGNAQQRYMQNMAMGARLMGNDAVANLAQQKADILATNRQGIAGLKGERGREIANVATTLGVQEAQDQLAAEQTAYGHFFDLLGYKEGKREFNLNRQDKNSLAMAQLMATQNTPAATGLPGSYLDTRSIINTQFAPDKQQAAADVLRSWMDSRSNMTGEYTLAGASQSNQVNPNFIGQWLQNQARKKYGGKFSNKDLETFMQMGRAYGGSQ